MKKIKIWLNSFNLVQQFFTVCFLAIIVFLVFFVGLLRNTIDDELAKTIMIIFGAIFFIIVIWVYSLIAPLNELREHIKKLKEGEDVRIDITRQDEIGEVAEAINEMHEELEKQNHIKEEMIHNISHDLKTPIATIKSYSESIKDGIYPYDTLEKSIDVIIEHADRLEKKVYSLITLNKMGYLEDNSKGDSLLMNDIVSKVAVSAKALRNDVNIIVKADDDVYFHGEEEPWRVVVENLVENASRYAIDKIVITLNKDELTVYNNGELMSEDRIDKLFKPYEKGTQGKFGLGLSIVKRVCDTYGYKVSGENKEDGVVFRIWRNSEKNKKK